MPKSQMRLLVEAKTENMTSSIFWDGKDNFKGIINVPSVGHSLEMPKTRQDVIDLLLEWSSFDHMLDGFNVTEVDSEALDHIMEGQEWRPFNIQG